MSVVPDSSTEQAGGRLRRAAVPVPRTRPRAARRPRRGAARGARGRAAVRGSVHREHALADPRLRPLRRQPRPAGRHHRAAVAGARGVLRGGRLHGRAGVAPLDQRGPGRRCCWAPSPGAVAAAATGWLAVRSGGVYFLMLTLAIGELMQPAGAEPAVGDRRLQRAVRDPERPGRRRAADPGRPRLLVRARVRPAGLRSVCGWWPARPSARRCAGSATTNRGCARWATRRSATSSSPSSIAGGFAGLAGGLLAGLVRHRQPDRRRVHHQRTHPARGHPRRRRDALGPGARRWRSWCSSGTPSAPSSTGTARCCSARCSSSPCTCCRADSPAWPAVVRRRRTPEATS